MTPLLGLDGGAPPLQPPVVRSILDQLKGKTCSPVLHSIKLCWSFCMSIHSHCANTYCSHTAYSVRYASCGLAQAFKRQWVASWVHSYINAKGAKKIKYGSLLSVWYQSIVPRSKIQLVSQIESKFLCQRMLSLTLWNYGHKQMHSHVLTWKGQRQTLSTTFLRSKFSPLSRKFSSIVLP